MNVNLNIERLVLDGISIPHYQRPILQAAMEEELSRLLAEGGLSSELASGGAVPSLRADEIQLKGERDPIEMGKQIARSVYGGIGR